ncbi:DUF364 domain-containing protein [Telmatospirillum sp.]|uniref:DUF364 domain-containing protein n=1 Tax=Telmatospirillum sp. TaxID=2079197 RepID=UPI00284AEC1A|nr:DUF364 domain-containing protein [Telmatospirillum sp.]MDR3435849.1 DUF364 domain-containing protein [Telmatospirillum sp.]
MWKIYDDLIAAVPEDSVVSECLMGLNWILVRSEGVGVAMTPRETGAAAKAAGSISGMKTRDLAQWVKSWNFMEAAIGLAAINSAINAPATVESRCGFRLEDMPSEDVFHYLRDDFKGKKVAVIGHFHGLEDLVDICELTILERCPQDGDLPDPACEYILGEQDIIVMTATTLINKTMPRLLQLGRNSRVVVCGPSTPMTPMMFGHGVDLLGGLVVENPAVAWHVVQEGIERGLLQTGSRMVRLAAPEDRRRAVAG